MAVDVLWTTAFIDMGAEVYDAGAEFWAAVTKSTVSPARGATNQFATLVPADGDSYIHVQRTDDDSSAVHLDLHVASPVDAAAEAVRLGATLVADLGYFVMSSPGGFVFCFVSYDGESLTPQAVGQPAHRVDQMSIDIPPNLFDQECAFWPALTGWDLVPSPLTEYRSFQQPVSLPIRFLLQRRDTAPSGATAHAHLDVGCGDHIEEVAAQHVGLGAVQHGKTKVWMQMTDPAGLDYCLTPRET